jgi:NAD-dependent protein deacetylase/lipoamidase sirtuin 4
MSDVAAFPVHGGAERTLAALLRGRRVVALTGAGLSTESGIPDYRGEGGRPTSIKGPDFRRSPSVRARYWARAIIGWERFGRARPNRGHEALAQLEEAGLLRGVVTQNVDRLHQRAGSRRVVELHGAIAEVSCLSGEACGHVEPREEVQRRVVDWNRELLARIAARTAAASAPDGDAELELAPSELADFRVPSCAACGAPQRPRVVLFGENVPPAVVADAFALLEDADALLVAGTSLAVYSGFRFLRHARERAMPIAIVNLGRVRGEEHAAVFVRGRTGEVLPRLVEAFGRG